MKHEAIEAIDSRFTVKFGFQWSMFEKSWGHFRVGEPVSRPLLGGFNMISYYTNDERRRRCFQSI